MELNPFSISLRLACHVYVILFVVMKKIDKAMNILVHGFVYYEQFVPTLPT
ncbi:MAG: hypothetical protein OWS03_06545 [Alicyclobacillaceae bacterium]|nr:hypothetical protein [Alicyclobacillaceae bacterium]